MTQSVKSVYLIANWKSHKTLSEARAFVQTMTNLSLSPDTHVIVCPPSPYLFPIHEEIQNRSLSLQLGTQDVSPFPIGAYTGAVAASMIQDMCSYAIVGHSERRRYFHETNDEVARKVKNVLDAQMTPVLCVDEPYLESQLAYFEPEELKKMIVVYEPLAAIGSGISDTPEHAQEIALKILTRTQVELPVLYGGSVTHETVRRYIDMDNISGVLVGAASLDPLSFSALVQAAI